MQTTSGCRTEEQCALNNKQNETMVVLKGKNEQNPKRETSREHRRGRTNKNHDEEHRKHETTDMNPLRLK